MCRAVVKAGQTIIDGSLLQTPSQRRPREPDDGKFPVLKSEFSTTCPLHLMADFKRSTLLQTLLTACHVRLASDLNWTFLWMSGTSQACPGGFWVISGVTTAARATVPPTFTQTK